MKAPHEAIINNIHGLSACINEMGCWAEVKAAMNMYADFRIEDFKKYVRHLEINVLADKDREIETLIKEKEDLKNGIMKYRNDFVVPLQKENEQLTKDLKSHKMERSG